MSEMHAQFLIELRDLLEKYDASIEVDYDDASDMHGVFGEKTGIAIGKDRFHDRFTIDLGDGWGVDTQLLDRAIEKLRSN